jgi:DNA-binding protein H-NS
MISIAMLNELRDDELETFIEQARTLLKQRDEDRKAKAISAARATLAAVGLTLKDLNGKARSKNGKGAVYHSGRTYQHPANRALTWNGKGKKPGWLTALEGEGKAPLEIGA